MSSLIPTHAADHVLQGLSEYLATSFSLAEQATASGLRDFLTQPQSGMFNGPYVRTRLPYAPANSWEGLLDWLPESFQPYMHQAQAFERLASKEKRPEPTLVVTGTGSGKTESFLLPILDHCRRNLGNGIKALILYPMNALANDQATRLSKLLNEDPALEGVRAGIYTGEHLGSGRTQVSDAGLITDRDTLRLAPPDILLTNYKMLDQLLLRSEDQGLWEASATTLQYVVLDEFHTYDGAQGTDVALLLRRMGLKLKSLQPEGFLTPAEQQRALGRITPVATSATLGDKHSEPTEMLNFAHTIFGDELTTDAVVRETMLDVEQWREMISEFLGAEVGEKVEPPTVETIKAINSAIAEDTTDEDHDTVVHRVMCDQLFKCSQDLEPAVLSVAHNPVFLSVLQHTMAPVELKEGLVPQIFDDAQTRRELGDEAGEFITHVLSELAHLRARFGEAHEWHGKKFPGVETQLWVREVSRIDRRVDLDTQGAEMFRWSDDGSTDGNWLPACYCRNCGRSGWMTALTPGDEFIETEPKKIRGQAITASSRQRPLIDASSEMRTNHKRADDDTSWFGWLHLNDAKLHSAAPDEEAEDQGVVPILTYSGENADEMAKAQRCPSCGKDDSIRYLGSSVATLLSVAISNLFGMNDLDSAEKKSLVFTDSVQDAAHRAGFVQARARTFAFRTRTNFVVDEPVTLSHLPDLLIESADEDDLPHRARFELLPPWVAENPRFRDFWNPTATPKERQAATAKLRSVLKLDLALEFGARSDLARSLVSTGTMSVGVEISDGEILEALDGLQLLQLGDTQPDAWVRGVLEHMRISGGINSPLLEEFLREDGNPYMLNRRAARARGIPPFAKGGAPEFPRLGQKLNRTWNGEATVPLGSSRNWYSRWSAKMLGISPQEAAHLVNQLFESLASLGVLNKVISTSGATLYALPADRISVASDSSHEILECNVCHLRLGSNPIGREVLEGSNCHTLGCDGRLVIAENPNNYYRRLYSSRSARTVVSREHTSLLDPEDRLAVEHKFKEQVDLQEPDAPNVLVATPTLEMGIDIGDLSTVMLSSLPDSVASYVQRVGRAGRLTGNSLVVALVRGRGKALARLNRPLETINGAVEPPAAFLSAREILHRQFTAFVLDSMDLANYGVQGARADSVFTAQDKPSVISALTQRIEAGINSQLDEFIATLQPFASEEVTRELRDWVDQELISSLERTRQEWLNGRQLLLDRRKVVIQSLDELEKELITNPNDEDVAQRLRAVRANYGFLKRQISAIYDNEYWISTLERVGVLPNFTLLDDSVEFHLSISKTDPESGEIETSAREYSRGISTALYELAPGATFYAQGIAAKVDSVELGPENAAVQRWRICPSCSYSSIEAEESRPLPCPACGDARFSDGAQVKNVVEMSKVYATVDYSRSAISDQSDERSSTRFERALSMVIPPNGIGEGWFLRDSGFGVQYLPSVEMRWLNLGEPKGGVKQFLAGMEVQTPLFRVCKECGFKDSEAGANRWQDHKAWCKLRNAVEEDTIDFALGRRLHTQGVLMHIPVNISAADENSAPSLIAALRMGFKLALGGNPDHLDVESVFTSDHGKVTPKLLLHDTVPGGTGYLSQFTSPQDIHHLLAKSFRRLSNCACQNDERKACPDCLLPFANGADVEKTSRESALSAITKILLDDIHPEPGVNPLDDHWHGHITEEIPETSDRSQLEAQFLSLLRQDLQAMNAKVEESTVGLHARWTISFPGSAHKWIMDEQKDFGGTRPDFYFETDRALVDKIAVYLDGAAYHASEKHNNVSSDIRKRNRLALEGILPWSMTMTDLRDRQRTREQNIMDLPTWFAPKLYEPLNQKFDVESSVHDLLKQDPMTQLLAILQSPTTQWERLGKVAATHALGKQDYFNEYYGPLISLTYEANQWSLEFIVNDGVPNVEKWNWFLRLTNLFYLAPSHTSISVIDSAGTSQSQLDIVHPEDTVVDVPEAWREILEDWEDDEDAIDALRVLAEQDALPPSDTGEEQSGIMTIARWMDARIALIYNENAADIADLQEQGWFLLEVDELAQKPQNIPDSLKKV